MDNWARHFYKKVESGSIINIDTIRQELQQDVDNIDDTINKINPYHNIIVNKAERDNTIISQMEQWSILSNVVNYVQYNRHPKNLEEQLYSLEQYIGCFWRLAFIHYCGLHQVWPEAEN